MSQPDASAPGAELPTNRSAGRKIVTLIYCLQDGQVLLLRRKKFPFAGFWTAPGGKVELGESPHSGARRELLEETGLTATTLELMAIITEVSPLPEWHWLMFVYVARQATGTVASHSDEGDLAWWPVSDLASVLMPDADRIFVPKILGADHLFREYTFVYDKECELREWRDDQHSGPDVGEKE